MCDCWLCDLHVYAASSVFGQLLRVLLPWLHCRAELPCCMRREVLVACRLLYCSCRTWLLLVPAFTVKAALPAAVACRNSTHDVVLLAVFIHTLLRCRPHPKALGAWPCGGAYLKATCHLQELVEDERLALPCPAGAAVVANSALYARHDVTGALTEQDGEALLHCMPCA
jgi:hypothetical protein